MLMYRNDYITSQILLSQTWMFKLACKLTLNLEDAKDLLQETILKILDNKNHFTQGTNFKGWTSVIMKNIFINHCRRAAKIKFDNDECESIAHVMCNKASDISADSNMAEQEIMEKINGCPKDWSQSFKLFIAGYSYKEISEKLALPIGTVKSRIFATRKKLQSILAGYK